MKTTAKFNVVYKENYSDILKFISFRINGNTMVAEELTDDVFVKVNEHLQIFDPEISKLKTWIHNIAKNIVIDYYRKVKENNLSINQLVNTDGVEKLQLHSNNNTSDLVEGKEISSAIAQAMDKLNVKEKKIAMLYYMHNKKYTEIAQILDIPLGSVKGTLLRAKESLQHYLRHVYKHSLAI